MILTCSDQDRAGLLAMAERIRFSLSGFWHLLVDSGFRPLTIAHVNTKVNHASSTFVVAGD